MKPSRQFSERLTFCLFWIILSFVAKIRLDQLLVQRGLSESRERAQRLIMAGAVLVNDHPGEKPGTLVAEDVIVRIKEPLPYVSRGGLKLAAALERFSIPIMGAVCADVGASTGGFTDCLLQRGAARVYAIDVGYGQLDWKLRSNPRVVVMDRTNARYLASLPEPIDVVTIDASFISLRLILPAVIKWVRASGHIVALVKPQFEAGRDKVGKGGVVRDPVVHAGVIRSIWQFAHELGFTPIDLIRSPIEGPAGNVEFLLWLRSGAAEPLHSLDELMSSVLLPG